MLYIMHRTQLYLEDDLWTALKIRAQESGTTISELVRVATRERYMNLYEERRAAMEAFVGIRADRPEFDDVDAYIRDLRSGKNRRKRLGLD
jgi:predicted DNA-binding ribbon-helix-helix protein